MRLKARVFFQQPTMGRNAYRLIVFLLAAGTVGVAPFLYISWKNMRAENVERVLYEQKLEYLLLRERLLGLYPYCLGM